PTPKTPARTLRVAAFTGSRGSTAFFRVRQQIGHLLRAGIEVSEYRAHFGSWPPARKIVRPLWLPATLLDRIPAVLHSYRFDLTWLHREMVSTLLTLEGFTRSPRMLDLDDAVWLNHRRRSTFPKLVSKSIAVVCGNQFIADHVRRWNPNTFV